MVISSTCQQVENGVCTIVYTNINCLEWALLPRGKFVIVESKLSWMMRFFYRATF